MVSAGAPDTSTAVTAAKPTRVSRAGRDLLAAIVVGVALGTMILLTLLVVRQVFIGLVALAVAVATWEVAAALRHGAGARVARVPVFVGGQAMVWLSWPFERVGLLAAFVVTALACLIWRFADDAQGYVRDVTASLFTVAYVPLFAAFAVLLVVPEDGAGRVVCLFLAVVGSDIGGYAVGALLGRHPMAPSMSPRKTWEGFAGSMMAGVAAGTMAVTWLLGGAPWQGALFGAAIVVSATVGDLVESVIKRDLGIKDMGKLLPGHGGLMDRLDSLLPSAVVSWLLLGLLVPVSG